MRRVLLLISILLVCALVVFVMSMLGTVMYRESKSFMRTQLEQSQRITAALRAYASTNDGVLPESLDTLVEAKLLDPQDLVIDLMDGKPPVRWKYFAPKSNKTSSLVLVSPPLSNDAGDMIRYFRALMRRPSLPQCNQLWFFGWLDGSAEAIPQAKLDYMVRTNGVTLSDLPSDVTEVSKH